MLNNEDNFIWPAEFICTIVDDNVILPNHYNLKIYIEPHVPVTENFGIGFEKLKYFIFNVLNYSIFINSNNSKAVPLATIDNNIVYFSSEPYDYYVGATLFSKFLTITEKYFSIYQISIDSSIGDRVQYNINNPYECGLDLDVKNWWNEDSPDTGCKTKLTWDGLPVVEPTAFQPKIIKGGKSEN